MLWLMMIAAVAAMGCDTVADITFINEELNAVTGIGFRPEICQGEPQSGACLPPGCGTLEFVMTTNRSNFVRPNMQLEGLDGRLEPGTNFGGAGSGDISFSNTWIFQLDDGLREGSTEVDVNLVGRDRQCASAADCAEGFDCKVFDAQGGELPSGSIFLESTFYNNDTPGVCAVPGSVTLSEGSLRYVSLDEDPQPDNPATSALGLRGLALTINMDNSGSLNGSDANGIIDRTAQTDPNNKRVAALKTFNTELFNDRRSTLLGRAEVALLEVKGSGSGGVTDVFLTYTDLGFQQTFLTDAQLNAKTTNNQSFFDRAVEEVSKTPSGLTPLWESVIKSSELFNGGLVPGSYATRVLAFVDSDSDGSSGNNNVESAISAFGGLDPELSIVHLDSLTPDPSKRQRVGPLPDYDRATCVLGGFYTYDVWPDALDGQLRRLARSYESRWTVDVEVFATAADGGIKAINELPPGWYRATTSMEVALGEKTDTFSFFAEKNDFGFNNEYTDSRLLFYVPDPAN